jgi:hypothetical protein
LANEEKAELEQISFDVARLEREEPEPEELEITANRSFSTIQGCQSYLAETLIYIYKLIRHGRYQSS